MLSQDLLHELFEYKNGGLYWKIKKLGVKNKYFGKYAKTNKMLGLLG